VSSRPLERGVQEWHINDKACSRVTKEEVKGALMKMKSGKAAGPDLIPVEI